ncbi:reverse transcriptase [Caerostris extrusa]|uniref:Reverse transcriptase n=1 Tax=Caerostris extrusa TaxID=172846 RepID=A0AAV4WZD8_CAEEX|nr:reverse transcriptase [Caerostris extrusa]
MTLASFRRFSLLSYMCRLFSKWPEAYPLVDISASSVASTFFGWFGPPLRIITDQGTQFEALTKFLGTVRHRTSPYHPAGNGQV